ncbi:MAG TPA: hypothetical protein VMB02_08965 [Candidatus Aquilonibacter sp.]|nr:hypothetical protein [Candidatus Aquilonibacter sp.]
MLSNTERGKAFQLLCRDALRRALGRDLDLEVPIQIGSGKPHTFDLATRERDVVAECKAFAFTATGNNPSAKITTLREATVYLRSIPGDVQRLLIVKHAPHPRRGETLGRYFVRLNPNFLEGITVLEMPEGGGDLVCTYGGFAKEKVQAGQATH